MSHGDLFTSVVNVVEAAAAAVLVLGGLGAFVFFVLTSQPIGEPTPTEICAGT